MLSVASTKMTRNNTAAEGCMPAATFAFSGQAVLGPWTFSAALREAGWSRYDSYLSQETELFILRLRELVEAFPTWQRRAPVGRRAADERAVLLSLILRQYFQSSFRRIESLLRIVKGFMGLSQTYDATTLSRKNRSRRFQHLFNRFHAWVLRHHVAKRAVVATDATGYGMGYQSWRGTPHGLRATGRWMKSHAAVQVPQLLYLSSVQTGASVHDSQPFEAVWKGIPARHEIARSLGDSAFANRACTSIARRRGATPLHRPKSNSRWTAHPRNDYERCVRFSRQFPNRFRALYASRNLVETTFAMTKAAFGDRLRSRTPTAQTNEIKAKQVGHNIRIMLIREHLTSTGV